LNNAVRAPPMCRKPVGDGAKRVTTELLALAKISPLALGRAFLFFPLCNATDERP
jgi:hypothetical protein